jgi:hypothetical protein
MKNLFVCSIFLLGFYSVSAQSLLKNALGLRLGSNRGFGTEVSYQMKLNSENRAEFNLGLRNSNYGNAIKLNGLYQWVWPIEHGFNWYAGVGGGLGSFSNNTNNSSTFVFAAGDIGIEYNFEFPLQASLDLRPEIGGNGYFENNFGTDLALSIRYKF